MKKLLFISLIGVVLATGAYFGRFAYRNYKEKRAIKNAEQFLEHKEFAKAMLSTRQALQLNPNNLAACRIMASLAEAGGSPHALGWRQRIAELEPTVDNKLALANCSLRFEPALFPIATGVLRELADKSSNLSDYHVLAGKLACQLNDIAKWEVHLTEAIRLDPKNEANRLELAALQMRSNDSTKAAEGRRILEEFRTSPKFGSEALRWLRRDRENHGEDAAALQFSLELHQRKDLHDTDRFEHLTLLRRLKNPEFAAYLTSLQTMAGTNTIEIYKVASWQIASDIPDKALVWLDTFPPTVQAENPVPVARAEAMAALKKWNELTDYLRVQKWNDQDFLRFALLSRALKEQKENEAAQANWSRSVRAASENPEQLSVLTQLAGKWGWETEVESLLWIITAKFPGQTWALESINRVYESNKNTAGLLRVAELRLQKNPKDNLSKNNVAMISLLLKTNFPLAHSLAKQVYDSDSKNWGFVSTYAYSLHAQGKTKEAVDLFQTLEAAELKNPVLAAYYVILLSAAGEKETARSYVALANQAAVLPEEKALLENAKRAL